MNFISRFHTNGSKSVHPSELDILVLHDKKSPISSFCYTISMNIKQPTAHVICGFIGAGKTTFARKLEKETGAVRITKDEWIVKIFGNKITSDKNFEKYDKNITKLAKDIAFKILESGNDVILDEGFWTKSQRDYIKKKILEIGAKPIFYYLECPIEIMRERVINRSKNPPSDSFEINTEMFDEYIKYWEPPTKEEGTLSVFLISKKYNI